MRPIKLSDEIIFADNKVEEAFNSLKENDWLKKAIQRAIINLKQNAFTGEKIRNDLIPKEYIQKYNIENLFWYSLPKGWRLVYSVAGDNVKVLAIIIEYFNHKDYERRFRY
jgi:Txe/YoeB family toxin of Txe-Axe toxin-antitoxin module